MRDHGLVSKEDTEAQLFALSLSPSENEIVSEVLGMKKDLKRMFYSY